MIDNKTLHETMENGDVITEEVSKILLELDETASVTTQADLNEMLVSLYNRLDKGNILFPAISGEAPCTKEDLEKWVQENLDPYTAGLFEKSIK